MDDNNVTGSTYWGLQATVGNRDQLNIDPICRDAGAGGQWGHIAPTTWKLWGRHLPTLDCQRRSSLFFICFARELGSLPPKNSGPNPVSF